MTSLLRVVADGLIHMAVERPDRSESARLLRDAAGSLLDADAAIEHETATEEANDQSRRRDDAPRSSAR